MFLPRELLPNLLEHLPKKQVTVLTGMRRTGKTTLLKKLLEVSAIEQQAFFDLERIDNRELFSEKNYELIVQVLQQRGMDCSRPVIIGLDEIQLVPNLPSVIKYLYDTYAIKFVVTGSSSYYLKNRFDESLAGRKKVFEVYPLTFQETLSFKGIPFKVSDQWANCASSAEYARLKLHYEEYVQYGGFPEVVLFQQLADKKDMLQDILSSYVNLDLMALADIKKSTELYQLIQLLAARIGAKLDISKLSRISGISRNRLEDYLALLEQSYLIKTIPIAAGSADRAVAKSRKLYFLDNGIANAVAELSGGAKFENATFNQLHHVGNVAYYALRSGQEIDFVINNTVAFKVKETPLK
ncbi:MAG: ATP-binding protein, partial [Bacteroidota bacterium]